MMSVEAARKIGINACIDKIGRDLCRKYADNATSAYGEHDGIVDCFVGVNDQPAKKVDINSVKELILSNKNEWHYYAECSVNQKDGTVTFM